MTTTRPATFAAGDIVDTGPGERVTPADWTEAQVAAYTFRAEIRAIEEGHRARSAGEVDPTQWHAAYNVVSHDEPDTTYLVAVRPLKPGSVVTVVCTCPSGGFRRDLPIPCKHAALVARRVEREVTHVAWADGLWRDTRPPVCPDCGGVKPDAAFDYDHDPACTHAMPDDPFAGLD